MYLTLSVDKFDEILTIPLSAELTESLTIQWLRCGNPEALQEWGRRLRLAIEPALFASLDADLRPPTKAQLSYAIAIAKALKVNLPGEALLHSGAMGEFLDRYAALYKEHRHIR